jgi:nucleotide-binding universal stress UspA family protein
MTPRDASNYPLLSADLEWTEARLKEKDIEVIKEIVAGHPAEKILEFADRDQPDLIVMGAKGRRHTLEILLGGIAQQVAEHADWPVLVVRTPYHGIRRILLAIDGSAQSQKAVEYLTGGGELTRLPLPRGVEIEFIHVLPPLLTERYAHTIPMMPEVPPPPPDQEFSEEARRQADKEECDGQDLLTRTIEAFRDAGLEAKGVLRRGDAATEIINYTKEQPVDLIISGSRGWSAIKTWKMGSVSRKLIHYGPCSVLVVKGPHQA